MCVPAQRQFERVDVSTPSAGRRFAAAAVVATLKPLGWSAADDVESIVSEYVTSAVRAGAGTIRVHIDVHVDEVDIRVSDDRPGADATGVTPMPEQARLIIAALTSRGDDRRVIGGQHVASAQVPCDPRATIDLPCRRAVPEPRH